MQPFIQSYIIPLFVLFFHPVLVLIQRKQKNKPWQEAKRITRLNGIYCLIFVLSFLAPRAISQFQQFDSLAAIRILASILLLFFIVFKNIQYYIHVLRFTKEEINESDMVTNVLFRLVPAVIVAVIVSSVIFLINQLWRGIVYG